MTLKNELFPTLIFFNEILKVISNIIFNKIYLKYILFAARSIIELFMKNQQEFMILITNIHAI